MLSDRALTTQASALPRARTLTGSMPTGIDANGVRLPSAAATLNTSRRWSAVLTASRRLPSGVSSSGWTCALSQATTRFCAIAVPAASASNTSPYFVRIPMSLLRPIRPLRTLGCEIEGNAQTLWRLPGPAQS